MQRVTVSGGKGAGSDKKGTIKKRSEFGAYHPNIMLRHRNTLFESTKPYQEPDLSTDCEDGEELDQCSDPDGLGQVYCWEDDV